MPINGFSYLLIEVFHPLINYQVPQQPAKRRHRFDLGLEPEDKLRSTP